MRCETMVRVARFELASLSAADFKSAVYANSTIPAKLSIAGSKIRTCMSVGYCPIDSYVFRFIIPAKA